MSCPVFLLHTGRYDWSGQLELAPDPFAEWQDAQALLATNTTSVAARHRSLLQGPSSGSTTSTGMVPVQGRVGIREAKASVAPGIGLSPGTIALDDGDIVLVCSDGRCPAGFTNTSQSIAPATEAPASGVSPQLLVIILAAVMAPIALAVCATGAAVVVLRKRRREDGQQAGGAGEKPNHEQKHGELAGRSGLRQGWRRGEGASPRPTAGPAVLRRSSDDNTDVHSAVQYMSGPVTSVERVQPGETGFGSMPGDSSNYGAMVVLPPARDSLDLFGPEVPAAPHPNRRRSFVGSLTGMAASLAQALHLRWVSDYASAKGMYV